MIDVPQAPAVRSYGDRRVTYRPARSASRGQAPRTGPADRY